MLRDYAGGGGVFFNKFLLYFFYTPMQEKGKPLFPVFPPHSRDYSYS
jgi:hypothetical protein